MSIDPSIRHAYDRLYTDDRQSPLKGIRSAQVSTVRHDNASFDDLVDMVNPLHHIPVVSSLYSASTGDTISPVAKLVGGGLIGGVFGLIGSAIDLIFEEATGNSLIGSVAQAVLGDNNESNGDNQAVAAHATQDTSRFYSVTPTAGAAIASAQPVDIHI